MERARTTQRAWSHGDSGQVTVILAIALSTFLLAFIGFGVDLTNMWFHRQSAQGAADAICLAGAMDMLSAANAGNTTSANSGGFTPGTSFDCNSGPGGGGGHLTTSSPCQYAALNGYAPSVLDGVSPKEGNHVAVTFPTTIAGVATPAAGDAGAFPFMRVDVTDRVKVYFAGLATSHGTMDVTATAKCGLQGARSPVPFLVLNPTQIGTYQTGGGGSVFITGGPSRSIQVNSKNSLAASIAGSGTTDLTAGGPNYNGSSFGVTGGPGTTPGGFLTNSPASWNSGTAPIPDPFRKLAPPSVTTTLPAGVAPGSTTTVPLSVDGCPLGIPYLNCTEYRPGNYPGGIIVQGKVALFAPGVYYIGGLGLQLLSNTVVRPTDASLAPCGAIPLDCSTPAAAGDGSMGTLFYFTNNGGAWGGTIPSVLITANSGSLVAAPFDTSKAKCPGQAPFDPVLQIPAAVDGNVLLAPCTTDGTYETTPTNVGSASSAGERGMLFFQDRSQAPTSPATLLGSGALLLNGAMYFHNCAVPTGTCSGATDDQTLLRLGGGSGTGTQLVGSIVVDKVSLQGNSSITMDLSSAPYDGLAVALLQ